MEAAKVLRLYDITDDLQRIEEALIEAGGVLEPEIEKQLDAIEGQLMWKVERVIHMYQNLHRTADAFADEAERLMEHARTTGKAAEALKAYLKAQLEKVGRDRIETPTAKVRIQRNSRPSIRWMRETYLLPEPLARIKVEVDSTKAYEMYKAEGKLPDGFEVATGSHLRIW